MAKNAAVTDHAKARASRLADLDSMLGAASSKGSQGAKERAAQFPFAKGNTAGQTAFEVCVNGPPKSRSARARMSLAYNAPASAATKTRMKSGIFQAQVAPVGDTPEATFVARDTTNSQTNTPFPTGCNTFVYRMCGKMKTNTRAGAAPVLIQRPSATADPLAPLPFNDGCQPASLGPILSDGVLVFGSYGQDLARLFLRSFNVVVTQCDTLIANIPLCEITCYDCGDTFEGASDQMYPLLPYVTDVNAQIDASSTLDGVPSPLQMFPQNTDGKECLPPVLVPVTTGAPTNDCSGCYDFAAPLVSLSDAQVNVSLEANPACPEDLLEFIGLIDKDTLLPIKPSTHNTGLVDSESVNVDASGAETIVYAGGFCFTLEFHGARVSKEELAACFNKYICPGPAAICDRLFPTICNTCKGIPNLVSGATDDMFEVDEHGQLTTGRTKDGRHALRAVPERESASLATRRHRCTSPATPGKPGARGTGA